MVLRPCSNCARHVAHAETRCPFCGVALAPAVIRPMPDVSRLSRSARLALGAVLAAATLPSCGGGSSTNPPPESIAQPYGAPPHESQPEEATPDAGNASGNGATENQALPVPAYGAPAPAK